MTASDQLLERPAYEAVAVAYDLLTAGYAYDRWSREIEALARAHGLRGRRLLDVACGTGTSFGWFLAHGWEVCATDVSPAMAAIAREKAGGRARVEVVDMREPPALGAFDLVTCLGDALNHLPDAGEVARALAAMGSALAPGGLLALDLNTLAAYRDVPSTIAEDAERMVVWNGDAARIAEPGGSGVLAIDVFERAGELWRRSTARHVHRHHPVADVIALVEEQGMEAAAVRGVATGGRLVSFAGEAAHPKALVLARRKEDRMPFRP
ncbi:MAG TPA: methyltransferase domain-containing protein [Solirubrobacteraceae bacterium]|nr:methyltransferase domain-containing protein [Solirubrobacteraceae bacterium]